VDPASMKIDSENGIRIRPEHIHESLREFAGIAQHPASLEFSLEVKTKEKLRGLWS
jgi:hypothetical protein